MAGFNMCTTERAQLKTYPQALQAWIVIALAWIAPPAQATVITIDVDYIERDHTVVCQSCGPSTITFNFDNNSHVMNWTFDWYGWTGMAHDAYRSRSRHYTSR